MRLSNAATRVGVVIIYFDLGTLSSKALINTFVTAEAGSSN